MGFRKQRGVRGVNKEMIKDQLLRYLNRCDLPAQLPLRTRKLKEKVTQKKTFLIVKSRNQDWINN